ncbi:MAG: septal ring lytic transglycosylase RlpA family protein [Candidatus Peribacteraceae bacterium]|nr:septal ring lytic transglycosylase RlpA family protein [Candidatus Peribacteraceae bacterium]
MFSFILGLTVSASLAGQVVAAPDPAASITRRDGFLLIWRSIARPAETTREKPYADVVSGEPGFAEITYAKARGILDDSVTYFSPSEPLKPADALRWMFRTRSVEPILADGDRELSKLPEEEQIPALADHYGISYDREGLSMTRDDLLDLMRQVDEELRQEQHEVSLYSEKFHGKGTAFGETFDMNAMTAAHRTFPVNTLVRVTNSENGKSVVVRINDRGPYVQGRDMDLSLGSFTTIADRAKGKINARFERLGDRSMIGHCQDRRSQRLVRKDLTLVQGVPRYLPLGASVVLSAGTDQSFVIRDVVYPDGLSMGVQTWLTKGEIYTFKPSETGTYTFFVGPKDGLPRQMTTEVVECGE